MTTDKFTEIRDRLMKDGHSLEDATSLAFVACNGKASPAAPTVAAIADKYRRQGMSNEEATTRAFVDVRGKQTAVALDYASPRSGDPYTDAVYREPAAPPPMATSADMASVGKVRVSKGKNGGWDIVLPELSDGEAARLRKLLDDFFGGPKPLKDSGETMLLVDRPPMTRTLSDGTIVSRTANGYAVSLPPGVDADDITIGDLAEEISEVFRGN